MSDLALERSTNGKFDLVFKDDLKTTDSLHAAVLLSLALWDREELPEGVATIEPVYGGWWGNALEEIPVGSRLWKLFSEKVTQKALDDAKVLAEKALKWLIDDGVAKSVSVDVQRNELNENGIDIEVKIEKPSGDREEFRWQANWNASV